MWKRRSLHECAEELVQVSERFRTHWKSHYRYDLSIATNNPILHDASIQGVELLRILALAVRSEQDFGLIQESNTAVGAIKQNASRNDFVNTVSSYTPPYDELANFSPLNLRQALNKIAHANPSKSSFFADNDNHDLILSGEYRSIPWVAVISILDLCASVKSLPDSQISPTT